VSNLKFSLSRFGIVASCTVAILVADVFLTSWYIGVGKQQLRRKSERLMEQISEQIDDYKNRTEKSEQEYWKLFANSKDKSMTFAVHAPPTPKTTHESSSPAIGHLKTRDKLITIRTGSDEPLYSVKSEDGTVLAVNVSATDLHARFPELKDLMERSIADWAGLDSQFRPIDSPIVHMPQPTYENRTIIIEHNNDR
jgi:hypothetical protein